MKFRNLANFITESDKAQCSETQNYFYINGLKQGTSYSTSFGTVDIHYFYDYKLLSEVEWYPATGEIHSISEFRQNKQYRALYFAPNSYNCREHKFRTGIPHIKGAYNKTCHNCKIGYLHKICHVFILFDKKILSNLSNLCLKRRSYIS